MRKRITVTAVKVANSGATNSVRESNSFGKPAIIRHNSRFEDFKGVKVPKNVGEETYNSFLTWLKALYPKDWKKRLADSSDELDKLYNKSKARLIGSSTRTIRKGYTIQVVR